MTSGSAKLNEGSPPKNNSRPPVGLLVSPMRDAVMVAGSKRYGTTSPPPPMTKNFVLSVFHALVSADSGDAQKRPTKSGRVFASVTRSIVDPKVGSVNWYPAPPSAGSGGGG